MPHIPSLYLEGPWDAGSIELGREHLHHLTRVLRMVDGEGIVYTDGLGRSGTGTLRDGFVVRGEETMVPRPDDLVIAVGPLRSKERMRFLVEKLTEVGATEIRWLTSRFGQAKAPNEARVRSWAIGALEQSRGAWLPTFGSVTWAELEETSLPVFVLDVDGEQRPMKPPCVLVVGPEGGFGPEEVPDSFTKIRLVDSVLRTETAAVLAAGIARVGG